MRNWWVFGLMLMISGCACSWEEGAGLRWAVIGGWHSKNAIDPVTWDAEHRTRVYCRRSDNPDAGIETIQGVVTAYPDSAPANLDIFTDETLPPADMGDELTIRKAQCAREDEFYDDLDSAIQEAGLTPGDLKGVSVLEITGMPMCPDKKGRLVHQYACTDGVIVEVSRGAGKHREVALASAFKDLLAKKLLGSKMTAQ